MVADKVDDDAEAGVKVKVSKDDVVRAILRGIKDGIRDEVLNWGEVSACFDDVMLGTLVVLVDKANAKRKLIPKEKRRPWKTKTS